MKDFVKLLCYEVHRFRSILFGLMGLTAVIQLGVLVYRLQLQVSLRREENLAVSGIPFSFADVMNMVESWFIFPILASIGAIGFYIFFIWYRDWVGRDTFIYRLLMLPTARRYIYLSKLAAILVFIFSLLGVQVVLVFLFRLIYGWMVPADLQEPSHMMDAFLANQDWKIVLPRNLDHFLVYYGLGILGVLVVFTCILLERSYRRIGILYGVGYALLAFIAVVWPVIILRPGSAHSYFYPAEVAVIELLMCAIVAAVSVWLGFRLLNQKITV